MTTRSIAPNTFGPVITQATRAGAKSITSYRSATTSSESTAARWLVLAMFWTTILCQFTTLKFIWNFRDASRVANIIALALLGMTALVSLVVARPSRATWRLYVVPGLLVFVGIAQNIGRNVIADWQTTSLFGAVIPWVAYLSVPLFLHLKAQDTERLWRHYYYFMLAASASSVAEYVAVFSDVMTLRDIETPYGLFLAGTVSMFHRTADGSPHFRLYSAFAEPGTFAMMLLPAVSYAYFNRRYLGLCALLTAGYLTYSLGGMFGFVVLGLILVFVTLNRRPTSILLAAYGCAIVATSLWIGFGGEAVTAYEDRELSRSNREDNVRNVLQELPALLVTYPFGYTLSVDTEVAQQNANYYGSNFTPGNYLQKGGISAFLGYVICLWVSFRTAALSLGRPDLSTEQRVVFSSLIVLSIFVVQREVVWDSALFAFLFAPTVITTFDGRRNRVFQAATGVGGTVRGLVGARHITRQPPLETRGRHS